MNARRFKTIILTLIIASSAVADDGAVGDRPDSSTFLSVQYGSTGYGLVPDEAALREQVIEPLFAFVFLIVEADSLGTWTADDLATFADHWGHESAFPLADHLESLTREVIPEDAVLNHRGARCRRRWVVRLRPPLAEFPLPFSILGYHPGSLSIMTPLVLNEWQLGTRTIHVTVEGKTRQYTADAITVWQAAGGWLILDVDGWLDRILGKGADDSVIQGFTACWLEGEMVGVGNSAGRKGRRIYGEFDFRTGEIENHGRPIARGLANYSSGWSRITDPEGAATWRAYEDR